MVDVSKVRSSDATEWAPVQIEFLSETRILRHAAPPITDAESNDPKVGTRAFCVNRCDNGSLANRDH
jgi:hypothetical protein